MSYLKAYYGQLHELYDDAELRDSRLGIACDTIQGYVAKRNMLRTNAFTSEIVYEMQTMPKELVERHMKAQEVDGDVVSRKNLAHVA